MYDVLYIVQYTKYNIHRKGIYDHLFWRNANLSFSKQVLDKGSDASAGDGDVLDAGPNDIAFRHRDYMGHSISRVNHHTCQRSLAHLHVEH